MVDQSKAIRPVESVVLAPLNEGAEFKANAYITFRVGASDLNMWLTNDSYLSFNYTLNNPVTVQYKNIGTAAITAGADKALPGIYIRNACNVFRQVEVLYGGKTLYSQPYNIEQNAIRMLSCGESYLNSNYATYTTNKLIKDGEAHLVFGKSGTVAALIAGGSTGNVTVAEGVVIRNVIVPINQLIPLFMDMTANGFPVRNLKSQIEIRLYVAEANRYLSYYDNVKKDFSNVGVLGTAADAHAVKSTTSLAEFTPSARLTDVRMYCSSYVPDEAHAFDFDSKCVKGCSFRYNLWQIALRQVPKISANSNRLPFNVVTENTKSFIAYCYATDHSPSVMIRPEIKSIQLTFGSNHIPKQPISGSSFEFPFDYKFTVDDVLDNIDKYYSESNMDYSYSYRAIERGTAQDQIAVPTSQFVLLGANYISDDGNKGDLLGANSSLWNSQYQLSFDADKETALPLTFVLGVNSDFAMTVKDGDLDVENL